MESTRPHGAPRMPSDDGEEMMMAPEPELRVEPEAGREEGGKREAASCGTRRRDSHACTAEQGRGMDDRLRTAMAYVTYVLSGWRQARARRRLSKCSNIIYAVAAVGMDRT